MLLADIYVLALSRTRAQIELFRDKFLQGFYEAAREYRFPQLCDEPSWISRDVNYVVDVLVRERGQHYNIYWNNPTRTDDIRNGILSFTSDAGLIVGLSVPVEKANQYLDRLKNYMQSTIGCVLLESPPPETAAEFALQ